MTSVLLFHLYRPMLPGGFVGVDVFFVLSGYLITRLLTNKDHAPTLIQFYQNRIARIAPASLLTIIATLLAGYWIYDEQTLAYLGSASLFAALSALNLKLLFQSSYFAASPLTQPLLHFWSLAVEEQFYLFYPAALLLLKPLGLRRVIAVAGIASLALCLWLTWERPVYAFYLLPTRAWELFAGGWLALRSAGHVERQGREDMLGWAGLALLLASFAFLSEARAFPGWQAILPVAATVLMLNATRVQGSFSAALSARPLVWVGLRSYSLYLWHWPVFSMADFALWQHSALYRLPFKIAATLALALLSYELVERPLRRRLRRRSARWLAFAGFALVVGAVGAGGYAVRNHFYLSAEGQSLEGGGYFFAGATPRVALIGDSEGAMYGAALRDAALRRGWQLRILAAAGTNQLKLDVNTHWPAVSKWLQADRPDLVVIAYAWNEKLKDGASLRATLDEIRALGSKVVIVMQSPIPDGGTNYEPHAFGQLQVAEAERKLRERAASAMKALISEYPGATIVDPAPLFLGPDGAVLVAEPGAQPYYYDAAHLSRRGADRVIPLLEGAVAALQAQPTR